MKARSQPIRRTIWLSSLLVLAVLILSACQANSEIPATGGTATSMPEPAAAATATTAPMPTEAPTEAAMADEAELSVATDPELGEILVGNNGMTLYMFTRDEENTVNCSGDCLVQWPPLITQGEPVLGEGVDESLVGTAELPDGQMIVTYNGMPLYYWVADQQPGDTTGQGVGNVWYVVSPEGEVIGMDAEMEATETPEAMETPEETAGAMAEGEAELSVATDPELGEILVGNNGMTLYMFTRDEENTVNCSGECLENWPPLVTEGDPVLGEGVDESLVGTADLPDGRQIVTYNGMPLYYWVNDTQPGDTTGQGVGGVWYVVSPEGEVIGMDEMSTPEAAGTASDEAQLSVATDPELGEILVGNDGMTLYMFTRDGENTVNCTGDCLVNWPPLVTEGEPVLGEGVDESLVGTAELPDGQMIVTYDGMPLYYWVNDQQPGDTTGQGVGSVWYVVSPSGEVIGQ